MITNTRTKLLASAALLLLAMLACQAATPSPPADTPYPAADVPSPTPDTPPVSNTPPNPSPSPNANPQPLIPDATYGQTAGVRYVQVPVDPNCANFTATPIIVGDWLIYPAHSRRECQQNPGPYGRLLFGYNLQDGQLYTLYEGAAGEAPLTYDAAGNTLYWTVTFGGTVLAFDPQTLELRQKMSVGITADSGGTLLDGLFYFGSINGPDPACQNPINPNCGALFAVDGAGNIMYQRDTTDGFRAWIGTSATTDGEYLYWGSAAQTVGKKSGDESEYLYGCSVIKTDKELNVLASFDPGDLACYALPFVGANMDSVSGEVVPDGSGVWVQYVRPNDDRMVSALYRLDNDLNEVCRVEFPFEPQTQAAGFYAAATVDAAGNAYLPVSVPDAQNTRRGQLWRVTPACEATLLAEVPGAFAHASPTLADDRYVLFATDGKLQMLTLDGQPVKEYTLASQARVLTSPVIHEGAIYVLQEDGTLNIIEDGGVNGYGNALWPRYRHDNAGSAALGSTAVSGTVAETAGETETAVGPKGTFITLHLEVSRGPRIKTLWSKVVTE